MAETIRFIGSVYPKGALINATLPYLDWKWEEQNITFRFLVKINNSTINVECIVPEYKPDWFAEIYKRAYDLARTAVNLACFAMGEGLLCIFEFAIMPDGTPSTLRLQQPDLAQYCKSYKLGDSSPENQKNYNDVAVMIATDWEFFATLNDLIESITMPQVAATNCGRVIDSIRRQIAPTMSGGQAWGATHKALNISRHYQEFVSDKSKGPRHGDRAFISGTILIEVTTRTWIIMDRYIEYRKRGKTNLAAPEFPLLQ
jgi:hypothetical protein